MYIENSNSTTRKGKRAANFFLFFGRDKMRRHAIGGGAAKFLLVCR